MYSSYHFVSVKEGADFDAPAWGQHLTGFSMQHLHIAAFSLLVSLRWPALPAEHPHRHRSPFFLISDVRKLSHGWRCPQGFSCDDAPC